MSLLKDTALPAPIEKELRRTVAAIPRHALVQLAEKDRAFAHGHRPIPANAEFFRQRLTTLLNAAPSLPEAPLQVIRMHSDYQNFTCVFSTEALVNGFTQLAHLIGGARLLLAMLLDPRGDVYQHAINFLKSNATIPEPASSSEAARTEMLSIFSPFIETLESILLPAQPPPQQTVCQPDQAQINGLLKKENQTLQNRITMLETKGAKLSQRLQSTTEQLTELRQKGAQTTDTLQKTEAKAATQRNRYEHLENQCSEATNALSQAVRDIASLRAELNVTRRQNHYLTSQLDEITREITAQELAAQAAAANYTEQKRNEFVSSLDTTLPAESSSRTVRERLGTTLNCHIDKHEQLTFLIDGYNAIHCVPKYGAKSLLDDVSTCSKAFKPLRKALEDDVRVIQSKLGACQMNLYYDGPTPSTGNPYRTQNIKILYSGGQGENRADKQIIGYASLCATQPSEGKLITVTDDNAIREEAAAQGSLILSTSDFIALV